MYNIHINISLLNVVGLVKILLAAMLGSHLWELTVDSKNKT